MSPCLRAKGDPVSGDIEIHLRRFLLHQNSLIVRVISLFPESGFFTRRRENAFARRTCFRARRNFFRRRARRNDRRNHSTVFIIADVDFSNARISRHQSFYIANGIRLVRVISRRIKGALRDFSIICHPDGIARRKRGSRIHRDLHFLRIASAFHHVRTAFIVIIHNRCDAIIARKDRLAKARIMVLFKIEVASLAHVRAIARPLPFQVVIVQMAIVVAHHRGTRIDILVIIMMESNFMAIRIAIAIPNQTALVMIMEIIPAYRRIVDVILCIQKSVITVLVVRVSVVKFAVVNPNVIARLIRLIYVSRIRLDADAIRVV